jgi:glycosyltransferase involved in cell wall biosynthesis
MRVLLLSKRRPQGRDLLARPFGRFHYLPTELALRGHQVTLLLASYSNEPTAFVARGGVAVHSVSIRVSGLASYLSLGRRLVEAEQPDWIGGLSDSWYALLAARAARAGRARLWIDAYDNYASYIPWAWPLHRAWKRAARQADLLTVAGPSLAQLLGGGRGEGSTLVLPMAPDPVGFVPGDRNAARARLGLPADVPLVAFGGGVHPSRDLKTLFRAVEIARQQCPQLKLVLSGRKFRGVELPADALWLGYLPDDAMPALYQAVDVVAVMNTPGAFGDYSYPIKLYEAMACGRPVVASRTASTAWILRDHPQRLVPPADSGALADALLGALREKAVDYGRLPTWHEGADALEAAMLRLGAG